MKTIQIKGASTALRERLQESADRNFRDLNQEALARLERSFALEDAAMTARDQHWVNAAMAGRRKPGSVTRLREIAANARRAVGG